MFLKFLSSRKGFYFGIIKYSHFLKDVLYFSLNLYTVFNPPTTVIIIKSRPTSPLKK